MEYLTLQLDQHKIPFRPPAEVSLLVDSDV